MNDSTTLIEAFRAELGLLDRQVEQLRTSYFIEGLPLVEAFEQIEVTDEGRVLKVLSEYLDLPLLEREDYPDKPVLLEDVSMSFLRKHSILPIQIESGRVRVVMNNPLNLSL